MFQDGERRRRGAPYIPPAALARTAGFSVGHYRRWLGLDPTHPPEDSPALECLLQRGCLWPLSASQAGTASLERTTAIAR